MNKTSKHSTFPPKWRYWRTAKMLQEESVWVRITENREHGSRWEKDTEKLTEKQRLAESVKRNWAWKSLKINPWRGKRLWNSLDRREWGCVCLCVYKVSWTSSSGTAEPSGLWQQRNDNKKPEQLKRERERDEREELGPVGKKNALLQFTQHTNLLYCFKLRILVHWLSFVSKIPL